MLTTGSLVQDLVPHRPALVLRATAPATAPNRRPPLVPVIAIVIGMLEVRLRLRLRLRWPRQSDNLRVRDSTRTVLTVGEQTAWVHPAMIGWMVRVLD